MYGRVRNILLRFAVAVAAAAICTAALFANGPRLAADDTMETAEEAVSAMNVGWNLGNTLDSNGTWITGDDPDSYETAWGNVATTKEMIDSVKAQGFNTIRIPVTWSQHITDSGDIDPDWLARVKTVVDYAYDDGMYVILNTHHDGGEGGADKVSWLRADSAVYESTKTKFAALWTNIATEFKDYDDHLIFEGYNELIDSNNTWNAPSVGSSAYDAVNGYAQTFVDSVRATGGNNAERNLMLQTYVGSWDSGVLDAFEVPEDSASDHLICSVHVYSPWGFTGTDKTVTWTSVHDDFTDSDKSEIDSCVSAVTAFSSRIGIPVTVGEFGAECKGNDDQIALYVQYFVSKMSAAGIKCIYWDNGDYNDGPGEDGGYAIFDRSSLKWKSSIVTAMMDAAAPYVTDNQTEETEGSGTSAAVSEESSAAQASESAPEETAAVQTEESAAGSECPVADDTTGDDHGGINLRIVGMLAIADAVLVAAAVTAVVIYRKKSSK